MVSLDYTALMQDAVEEQGGGVLGLAIDRRSDSIFTVRAGVETSAAYAKTGYWSDALEVFDGVWRPRLALRWRQVVTGADRSLTSHIVGAPQQTAGLFRVKGDDAGQGFEVGAGIDFTPKPLDRVTFGLQYDAFLWTGITSHDLSGRVRISF